MYFNNLVTILSIIGYSIVVVDAILVLAAKMRKKLGKKSVIITIVCILVVGLGVSVGAKFLPNGDNQTIVPSVTPIVSTTIPVSTLTTTVTSVPSATGTTPTNSNPTATLTPVLAPTPLINPALRDAEFPANDAQFPFTIVGPAIVEWADPGCGIFELNAGKSFTWNSDGHYWIFLNQASLDYYFPGHLKDYQSKNPASCMVGSPS